MLPVACVHVCVCVCVCVGVGGGGGGVLAHEEAQIFKIYLCFQGLLLSNKLFEDFISPKFKSFHLSTSPPGLKAGGDLRRAQ